MPVRRRPVAEALEPRLLYSADALPVDAWAPDAMSQDVRLIEPTPLAAPSDESLAVSTETLIFIDASLPDADRLAADLLRDAPDAHIVWLNADNGDVIDQIGEALAARTEVSAIHLVSHGSDGSIVIGDQLIDAATLEARAADFADWQTALSDQADVLIYGCNVAATDAGQTFARRLAELTGADVAASNDLSGTGGDWVLERVIGSIEAQTLGASQWIGTLTVTPATGDIDLNTNVSNNQRNADVAMFNDGAWVAVWQDQNTNDITARLYQADGTPTTGEFQVNLDVGGKATLASVATDGNSTFAVAFTSDTTGNKDIYVRLFDLAGNAITGDIQVNAGEESGDQDAASIAMNDNGQFVVTWEGNGTADADGVYVRKFNSDGSAAGAVMLVNETTGGSQKHADVAMRQDGGFVVTWLDTGSGNRIMARRYDAAGTPGSEFAVRDSSADKDNPAIAIDGDDNFAIVWSEYTSVSMGDGIWLQRYNADGSQNGSRQVVNTVLLKDQNEPDIAMTRNGDFVVSWTDDTHDGDKRGIFLRAYVGGSPDTGEVAVNGYISGDQLRSAIAVNDAGKIVVAWDGKRSGGNNDDVSARMFDWPEGIAPNTAPTLDTSANPTLDNVLEDAAAPVGAVGTLISDVISLVGSGSGPQNVTDPDAGAQTGMALVAADDSQGSWYFSIDDGASWTAINAGTLSTANALLLSADSKTRVAFVPGADYNGVLPSALTFRAWDRTTGSNGSFADTSSNGADTAFSTAIDTASLTVTAVNDVPVVVQNQLTLTEGQSVVLATADLSATDVESTATALSYSVVSVSGGFFAFNTAPGTPIVAFTQQQIDDGDVRFVHDGGEAAPSYTLNVSDPDGGVSLDSSATITFTNVNDAPVLAATPLVFNTAQGSGAPVGAVGYRISVGISLAGSGSGPENVTDPDAGAVAGFAFTAADETHGLWYFSLDDGANWQLLDLAGLPAGDARLLLADGSTRLYFQHTDIAVGTFTNALTFHAWDGTSGSNGGSANPLPGGGSSAFSVATATADLFISSSNTTPVLNNAITPTVIATEDAPAPSGVVGFTMAELVSLGSSGSGPQNVTDPDSGALTGIALTGTNTPNGSWWVSTDNGANWSALPGGLSDNNALLLANDSATRLYYQPAIANDFGSIANALQFRAWDQSAGANGSLQDTTIGNAFSAATSFATLDVQGVNDAPSIDTNSFTITEGGQLVLGAGNLSASDVESAPAALTYTASAVTGGHFALIGTPGTPITSFTQAQINAGQILFAHDGGEVAPSFDLSLSDGTDAVGPVSGVIAFTPVNDAPSLTASALATLSLDEDAGVPVGVVGAPVSALVSLSGSGSGPQNVVDADAGGLTGIAITAADTSNGSWYFTTDNGTTWQALGGVSTTSARLLGNQAGTRLAFAPNADYNGTTPAALSFVAWDQSSGAQGALGDTTTGTAFSAASDTLTLIVRAVNDDPLTAPVNLGAIAEDGSRLITQADLLAGSSDPDGDALEAVYLTLTGGNGTLVDNSDGTWTFTPDPDWNGAASFSFDVDDGTARTANTASLSVSAVNDAPVVSAVDLGTVTEDTSRLITQADLLAGATDVENDPLVAQNLVVVTGSGTLIDNGNGTWTYNPSANENGSPSFAFDVTDGSANTANTASFAITPVNDAPDIALNTLTLNEGQTVLLGAGSLIGNDPDTLPGSLTYTVSAVSQGYFATVSTPGTALTSFTQAQLNAGQIAFHHDGGELAPAYSLVLSDGALNSPLSNATISFTNVNDAPTVGSFNDQSITAGGGFGPLNFTISDIETAAGALTVSVSSSEPDVIPAAAIVVSGTGANRSIEIVGPHAGTPGVTTLTVSVSDGTTTTTRSFDVFASGAVADEAVAGSSASKAQKDNTVQSIEAPPDAPAEMLEAPPVPRAVLASAPPPLALLGDDRSPVDASAPPPVRELVEPEREHSATNFLGTRVSLPATDMLALYYATVAQSPESTAGQISHALREETIERAFEQLRENADQDEQFAQATVGVTVVTGAGLTIGYVVWLIRGGVLLTSLLTTMPAWRLLDPLPILGNAGADDDEDDDSLQSMVAGTDSPPRKPTPEEPTADGSAP